MQLSTASTSQEIASRNLVESENESDSDEVIDGQAIVSTITDAFLTHFGNLYVTKYRPSHKKKLRIVCRPQWVNLYKCIFLKTYFE